MQKLIENFPSDWGKNTLHLREIKVKNKIVEANGKSVQVDKGYEVGCWVLDTKNKNGRIYSTRLAEHVCREGPQKTFALKDHPPDDGDGEGSVDNIVAVSENPHIRDGVFYVNTFFVDEEFQEKVSKIISRGIGLGVSSSCWGDVDSEGQVLLEGFSVGRFFDFVISPSGNVYLTKESILENEKYHSEMEQKCFKHLAEAAKKHNKNNRGEKKVGSILDEEIMRVIGKNKKEGRGISSPEYYLQNGLLLEERGRILEEGIFEISASEQERWKRLIEAEDSDEDSDGENETDDKIKKSDKKKKKDIDDEKKKIVITISAEFDIPGTDFTLEKGDKIEVNEQKKYKPAIGDMCSVKGKSGKLIMKDGQLTCDTGGISHTGKPDSTEENINNSYRRYKTMQRESLPYNVDADVDILVLQNRQERKFALKGFWESSVKERLNREALDYLSNKNGNEKISVGLDKAEKTLFIFSDVLAEDLNNFEFDDKGELTVDQIDAYTAYNNLLLVGGGNTLNENFSVRDRMPAMREGWETAPVAKKKLAMLREGWE